MPVLKLQTTDNQKFEIDSEVMKFSITIQGIMKFSRFSLGHADDIIITLSLIDGSTLQKIIDWGKHHQDDKYLANGQYSYDAWDNEFFNRQSDEDIRKIVDAADFLQIEYIFGILHGFSFPRN